MDPPSGYRDSQSETWSWEEPSGQGSGRGPPWRPLLVAICALGLAAVVLGLILSDDGGERRGGAGSSVTPASTKPQTVTPSGSNANSPAPTISAAGRDQPTVELLGWSRESTRWYGEEIPGDKASVREGESIPVLMRLDGAVAGRLYAVTVRYQCATDKGAAFDFLAAAAEGDAPALLTEPGPGRVRPDSTISIPDDQSIGFDDDAARSFQLWGGTFHLSPQGPAPSSPCLDVKKLNLTVIAQEPSVYLIWAAHLASAASWGPGRGAAAQDEAIFVEASVTGTADSRLEAGPDVVEP